MKNAIGNVVVTDEVEIADVTTDSRRVVKGSLYIALDGVHTDGHKFIADAAANGASAILAERMPDNIDVGDAVVILTGDTHKASSRIYSAWYGGCETGVGHKTRLVAVTGTNGKTTVAHMLRAILTEDGSSVGIIGTVGASLGEIKYELGGSSTMTTPSADEFYRVLWDMIRRDADFIVFEASSHGIAQGRLAGIPQTGCELSAAIFTNLSPEHMDYHITMEDYFLAKSRLFTELSPKVSIINVADEYGERLCGMLNAGSFTAVEASGTKKSGEDCKNRAASMCAHPENVIMRGAAGVEYVYASVERSFAILCRAFGRYAVENSMMAAACALSLGVGEDAIADAMAKFGGVRGRMERIPSCEGDPEVFIDFAHTPAALEGVLISAREAAPTRRLVVVFGCGGDRDRTKRSVMGRAAVRLADLAVITSDNRRTERAIDIIDEILAGVIGCKCKDDGSGGHGEYVVIPDRTRAIEYAIVNAEDGDMIILAGKGHETYEDAGGEKRRFDEREIAERALAMRRWQREHSPDGNGGARTE